MDYLNETLNCDSVAVKPGFVNIILGKYEMNDSCLLDIEHQNIIKEKLSNLNRDCFQCVEDAYEDFELAEGGIIVFKEDMKTKMEIVISTYSKIDAYSYSLKNEKFFYNSINKYYLPDNISNKQAHITIDMINNFECEIFKIHYYQNGLIYLHGCEEKFNSLPIEYCKEILDECVNKINNKEYNSFIPSAEVDVYYEKVKQKIR